MADISLRKDRNYSTKLFTYLNSVPEDKLYHQAHSPVLHHPADILIDQLKNFKKATEVLIEDKDRESAIKGLYLATDTFYDNCFSIIKTFFPTPMNEKKNPVTYQWLKDNNIRNGNDFYGRTNAFHLLVSTAENLIKHDDPKIESFSMTDEKTGIDVSGFFVSSVLEGNKTGPNPQIHKHWKGKRTATSINYFIKRLVAQIFYYEDCLLKALPEIGCKDNFEVSDNYHRALFEIAFSLPCEFYPDEYTLPCGKYKET